MINKYQDKACKRKVSITRLLLLCVVTLVIFVISAGVSYIAWLFGYWSGFVLALLTAVFLVSLFVIALFSQWNKKLIKTALLLYLVTAALFVGARWFFAIRDSGIAQLSDNIGDLHDYLPFQKNKLVKLDQETTLLIREDFPVIDGATALFPLYSAVVETVYEEKAFLSKNTKKGKIIMFFVVTKILGKDNKVSLFFNVF